VGKKGYEIDVYSDGDDDDEGGKGGKKGYGNEHRRNLLINTEQL